MKRIIGGFILGALLFGSMGVYAAGGNLIEVFYSIKAIKIDNVSQSPNKKPFAYEGTTYVPLRFISENLGKEVKWDQKTQTIFIGNQISDAAYYLGDQIKDMNQQINRYNYIVNGYQSNNKIKSNVNVEYENYLTFYLEKFYEARGAWSYIEYPLNGQFKTFRSTVGLTEEYKNTTSTIDVRIYADDQLIYQHSFKAGDMPTNINLNVEKAIKLKIETSADVIPGDDSNDYSQIGLFNPYLLK